MGQFSDIWAIVPLGPILLILVPIGIMGLAAFLIMAWALLARGDDRDLMRKPWKDEGQ